MVCRVRALLQARRHRRIAPRSQDVYLNWSRQIARHDPEQHTPDLASDDILDFLVHIKDVRGLAGSTVNQAVCGLRHLYNEHLERGWDIWKNIKIPREEPLPHFLTRPKVDLLLGTFHDARYLAFFTTVYQTGSEKIGSVNNY